MRKKYLLFSLLILVLSSNSQAQSCEIFEIPNVNVYLYPLAKGVSYSTLNDSIRYSIEKISVTKFRVKKLFFKNTIETKDYKYKGKTRSQIFKVKRRSGDQVSVVREKKTICLLE